jgi:hypothetical protein
MQFTQLHDLIAQGITAGEPVVGQLILQEQTQVAYISLASRFKTETVQGIIKTKTATGRFQVTTAQGTIETKTATGRFQATQQITGRILQ